ncbi:MAG: hypothetical protein DRJ10_00270 [Bacteroidetes bacterium]|nr:MAG: hypothetical protein DRJ10_00270 [Bacteroidota bacterium]
MINIFIIDDHPVVINGIRLIFGEGKDKIKVSGWANSAKEAIPKLKKSHAQVVLLDLVMPEYTGVEFCLFIKKHFPDKKVIALTGELDTTILYNTWMNKADAILIKNCGKEELVEAIHGVLAGRRIIGNEVPDFSSLMIPAKKTKRKLTPSEQRILKLLAEGHSRPKVGEMIGSSEEAINFHCKNLLRKFNTNKMIVAIEQAMREKLIS